MITDPKMPTYARALALAWPASIASMATPLLGAIDVWALGQSERPLDIAAVGLGSVIFSLVYWSFGFIRMSVAGLTAQAIGAGDESGARAALARGFAIGAGLGLFIFLAQGLIGFASFKLLGLGSEASGETMAAARDYYSIRIWGAPFALGTYALFGWLTARGRTDFLMIASLAMTVINIVLDYWFVVDLQWGAWGVGLGTLIAETAGFVISAGFILRILAREGGVKAHWRRDVIFESAAIKRTLTINVDIFIRTLLLALSFAWFTQRSGAFGDVTLAANQALLQLFLFTGLALDGTAIAAETLVGQAIGGRSRQKEKAQAYLRRAVRVTSAPAAVLAVIFALVYLVFGPALVALLTPEGAIRAAALEALGWVIVSPIVLAIPFQLDGIFIGATRMREMRDGMILSAGVLLPSSIYLAAQFGNHGLWAAFTLYFILRGVTLAIHWPRLFGARGAVLAE